MDAIDRLSALDLMTLWPDDFGWPEDIGAVAFLDGSTLFDERGNFSTHAVRAHIQSRLDLVPCFRKVLLFPRLGFGWPMWVDANRFDIREHVQTVQLADEEEATVLETCEKLRCRPFDRSRPLWAIWFLVTPRRRVAMFFRVHHAMADGMSGVAALGAFLDIHPTSGASPDVSWAPKPRPSGRALLLDNIIRRVKSMLAVIEKLMHPATTFRRLRSFWPAFRESFGEGRAPRLSLNRRVGEHRRFAFIRVGLDGMKRVAHTNEGKVNDVLLALVTGGLGALLSARGERVDVQPRAFTPVSLHTEAGPAEGNADGAMVVPLPVELSDARERLRSIVDATRERKKKARPHAGSIFRNIVIQRAFLRFAPRQRMVNVYVANVPGPSIPLYFMMAPVDEVFPIVPIIGNIALGVGALSYSGQFNITVVADRDRLPDLDEFVRGIKATLEELQPSDGGEGHRGAALEIAVRANR